MPSPHQSPDETEAFTALMTGIALFIDDDIDNENDDAFKLKDQITKKGIPLLPLRELPKKDGVVDFVSNLHGISFMILDWQFNSIPSDELLLSGASVSRSTSEAFQEEVLSFIKIVLQKTYCPIFIFSRQSDTAINDALIEANIIGNDGNPRILIKSKKDLLGNKLFAEINTWINMNPIIYVLKTWEKAAKDAKLNMFYDLENKSSQWPSILWKTFEEDDSDPSTELTQVLSTLFVNRFLFACKFSKDNIDSRKKDVLQENDIRNVLEGTRFIPMEDESSLNAPPAPGDLFWDQEGDIYYVNIRAQCGTLHDKKPCLYCIKGKAVTESRIRKRINNENTDILFQGGELRSKKNLIYIPFAHGNKILEFNCRCFTIFKYNNNDTSIRLSSPFNNSVPLKVAKRIGRILPPYITHIQQIVSSYIIREGLPAIPENAIPTPERSGNSLFFSVSSPGIDFNNEKWSFISSPTSIYPQIISISCKSQLD